MCFYIHPKHAREQTAKKDITVYKEIFRNNLSYWRCFEYSPNTLYQLRKPLKHDTHVAHEIHEGFHSYDNLQYAYSIRDPYAKIVKFVIPKGAKYYHNSDRHEYVSTSIRSGDLAAI